MRKLLTGYAISYNRRHRRHGHLFQNRYKSIICEEDAYFTELVRYIHLNPLRAGIVESLSQLDCHRWCGHAVVLARRKAPWQDRDYVLKWFGRIEGPAKRAYRAFVKIRYCKRAAIGTGWRRTATLHGRLVGGQIDAAQRRSCRLKHDAKARPLAGTRN